MRRSANKMGCAGMTFLADRLESDQVIVHRLSTYHVRPTAELEEVRLM